MVNGEPLTVNCEWGDLNPISSVREGHFCSARSGQAPDWFVYYNCDIVSSFELRVSDFRFTGLGPFRLKTEGENFGFGQQVPEDPHGRSQERSGFVCGQ